MREGPAKLVVEGREEEGKVEKRTPLEMEVEAILFVPYTPGSKLKRRLQECDNTFATLHGIPRIKVVERGGTNCPPPW